MEENRQNANASNKKADPQKGNSRNFSDQKDRENEGGEKQGKSRRGNRRRPKKKKFNQNANNPTEKTAAQSAEINNAPAAQKADTNSDNSQKHSGKGNSKNKHSGGKNGGHGGQNQKGRSNDLRDRTNNAQTPQSLQIAHIKRIPDPESQKKLSAESLSVRDEDIFLPLSTENNIKISEALVKKMVDEFFDEQFDQQLDEQHGNVKSTDSVSAEKTASTDVEVIGVRFKSNGKTYYFAPEGNKVEKGTKVIVETARGLEFGEVWLENSFVSESKVVLPLRPMIRVATDEDVKHNENNRRLEKDAFGICMEKIDAHKLDMKLVDVQYTFDNTKLLFYFTSAGRVDFRELVKDVASVFRTRIEFRQIGVRDEAKLMGGIGPCGRRLCCTTFLPDFAQVSIKMAKDQGLSLNSSKNSGCCGRLMCCLRYENDVYAEELKRTPPVDSTVMTEEGVGTVTEINPLAGTIKVKLHSQNELVPKQFSRDDVELISSPRRSKNDEQTVGDTDETE